MWSLLYCTGCDPSCIVQDVVPLVLYRMWSLLYCTGCGPSCIVQDVVNVSKIFEWVQCPDPKPNLQNILWDENQLNEHEIPNFEYWLRTRFKLPGNPIQSLTKVVSSENIRELSHNTFLNLKKMYYTLLLYLPIIPSYYTLLLYPPIGYVRSIIKLSNEKYVLSPEHNSLFKFINRKYIISYPHPFTFFTCFCAFLSILLVVLLLSFSLRLSFPFLLLCRPTPTFLLPLSILLLPLLSPSLSFSLFKFPFPPIYKSGPAPQPPSSGRNFF